jgi:hypothetical protein
MSIFRARPLKSVEVTQDRFSLIAGPLVTHDKHAANRRFKRREVSRRKILLSVYRNIHLSFYDCGDIIHNEVFYYSAVTSCSNYFGCTSSKQKPYCS